MKSMKTTALSAMSEQVVEHGLNTIPFSRPQRKQIKKYRPGLYVRCYQILEQLRTSEHSKQPVDLIADHYASLIADSMDAYLVKNGMIVDSPIYPRNQRAKRKENVCLCDEDYYAFEDAIRSYLLHALQPYQD